MIAMNLVHIDSTQIPAKELKGTHPLDCKAK